MSTRTIILFVVLGSLLAAAIIILGFIFFPTEDLWLNLISEAVGVIAGGLVLFAILEAYLSYQKQREWERVQDELFNRIYWEIEILQFNAKPIANWHVGLTLSEELRELVELGPRDQPIKAAYFLDMAKSLEGPLSSLNSNVTPRVVALTEDKHLTHALLELEQSGLKIKAACHSLSEFSGESNKFTELINEVLERAATVIDCLDQKRCKDDLQQAAQARFERLNGLEFSTTFSSDSRTVYKADGTRWTP